jgi:hypothetical protein
MSQGTQGLDIQNVSGANYRQYVNEALKQVATMSSGATAPSNPQQQQLWFDTSNQKIKMYSGTTWNSVLSFQNGLTSIGFNAAANSNSTNNNIVAIGQNCCLNNTSGIYNVGVGIDSLRENTTGSNNTAVGVALISNQASNNTAVGFQALNNNTTGSNNTAIGYNAGVGGFGINITTQSNLFILGNSSVTDLICADTSISGHSDARDKKDIEALNFSGLAYINALIPRKFTWDMRKCVGTKKDITEIGFIAQEVEFVQSSVYAVPGIVSTYDIDYTDPETDETIVTDQKLIAPAKLIPILVKAIQELTVRVELLETALQAQ